MRSVARFFLLTSALVVLAIAPSSAYAFEFYVPRVPRQVTAENSAGEVRECITCHNNPDGGGGCAESPCLNPFGGQFRTAGANWSATLAAMDADGDGFTNGQELQDASGGWRPGAERPGNPDYVTAPGSASESPGLHDDDGDGYCWFGRDLNDDGDCVGPGENDGSLDCNDMNPLVSSGATEMCTNTTDDDCDGLPTLEDPECESITDGDGDGVCPMGRDMNGDRDCLDPGEADGSVDCDDEQITVFPGNRENCADGRDNDCNGDVDADDGACRADTDADGDGYCPIGRDLNMDGDCLDGEEPASGFDCDDTDPNANPDEVEICDDLIDNDCDGNANFDDSECRGFFDSDGDRFCPSGEDLNRDGDCIDEGESREVGDCDDTDPMRHPEVPEVCTNSQDDDCDGIVSLADTDCRGYLDRDGDRYCFVGFDQNRDGDCADAREEGGLTDCDDTNPMITPAVGGELTAEVCTDEIDNDCDGSIDAFDSACFDYLDRDGDGWCPLGRDGTGDGDCVDPGEQAPAPSPTMTDLDDEDPSTYPGAPENCIDRRDNDQDSRIDEGPPLSAEDYRDLGGDCVRDVDADEDGYCPIGQDLNGDGDCEDAGEGIIVSDCDDMNPDLHPGIAEECLDGIDNDCDGDRDLFDSDCFHLLDLDGDGYCGVGIDDNRDGDCLDEAEDRFGVDCDDGDPAINIRQREVCDDGIDNDCDDRVDDDDPMCICDNSICDDDDPCTIDICTSLEGDCVYEPNPECSETDAGVPDAGAEDGGADAGMMDDDDDGCGCAAPGLPSSTNAPLGVGLLLLGVVWRRRRA